MATQVAAPPLQCILQQQPTCAVGRRTKAAWGTRTRRCNPPIVDRVFWGNFSLGHHPVLMHSKPLRANKLQTVEALFQFGKKKAAPKVIRETVIPEPDYRISLVLLGTNLLPTLSFCTIVCVVWEKVYLRSFISAYFCV
jgi:hypothetical protein